MALTKFLMKRLALWLLPSFLWNVYPYGSYHVSYETFSPYGSYQVSYETFSPMALTKFLIKRLALWLLPSFLWNV